MCSDLEEAGHSAHYLFSPIEFQPRIAPGMALTLCGVNIAIGHLQISHCLDFLATLP